MVKRWSLQELVNFEVLLKSPEVSSEEQDEVQAVLDQGTYASETARRRAGLRTWYEQRVAGNDLAGHRVGIALSVLQWISVVIALLAGIGLMAGLVERVGLTEGKAYNVWKLLAIPIGGQWLIMLIGVVSWLILRRQDRKLTLLEEVVSLLVKRLSGGAGAQGWNEVYQAGAGYREILGWRLARLSQWAALSFNVGLLVGFYSILLFLEINFFWATTIEEFGLPQLQNVTQLLGSPWGWLQPEWVPQVEQMAITQLQIGELNPEGLPQYWYPFLMAVLIVWGVLPRGILVVICMASERRALRRLTFMERRHRDLWRQLMPRVSATSSYDGPGDGVVLIDTEGAEPDMGQMRPFLLQQLRVNIVEQYTASGLSGQEQEEALQSLRRVGRGALLLVESWSLSPKKMTALHQKVREAVGRKTIFYLVIGLPSAGQTQAPESEEFRQWEQFVAGLQDPECEVIAYQP